jgi:hypothetical protein
VKETYQVGGITITGPIDEMRRHVRVSPDPDDAGWQITVESPDRPSPIHQ